MVAARAPAPDWMTLPETRVAGFPVVTASRAGLVAAMIHDCRLARSQLVPPRLIFDINGHAVSASRTVRIYRKAMAAADVIHADGAIWVAMSKLTGRPIEERSATTDMMTDFAAVCEQEGLSFFVLGGSEDANLKFCDFLARDYPRLRVAGRWNGYFGVGQEEEVIAAVDAAQADVVWVGMGKPREQVFSITLRDRVRAGWIVTCGGCYNYFAGGYKRAPLWMQNNGLEWLHRMASDPRRFGWRYITTNPHALVVGLIDLIRLRLGRDRPVK